MALSHLFLSGDMELRGQRRSRTTNGPSHSYAKMGVAISFCIQYCDDTFEFNDVAFLFCFNFMSLQVFVLRGSLNFISVVFLCAGLICFGVDHERSH